MRQAIQTEADFETGLERVTEEYVVEMCGERVVVPVGFEFNGSSIPRAFWWLAGSPFTPRYRQASGVHDRLYETHDVDRKIADRIYAAILIRDGVSPNMAALHYNAIRLFGWIAWRRVDVQS